MDRARRRRGEQAPVLNSVPALRDLRGLWRRLSIRYPDGSTDTTTRVAWLQGETAFIDLRQPADLGDCCAAHCRSSLSALDCAELARQQGFAGTLAFDGAHFEWTRVIDYQPKARTADAGSLVWRGDLLIEQGRDVAYVEHWRRDDGASAAAAAIGDPAAAIGGEAAAPTGALRLRGAGSGTRGALLRVGAHFMYARDRAVAVPEGRSLADCVADAACVGDARELVDCEISFGTVSAHGLRITASTLPYRVGDIVSAEFEEHRATTSDRSSDGAAVTRAWEIVGIEGAIGALRSA